MVRAIPPLLLPAAACAQSNPPQDLQLFLLIGQSNMAGRGVVEAQDRAPLPRVWSLNEKKEWEPAADPLHFDKPAIAGVGLGRSFARSLAGQNKTVSIGLIPAAFGGSALREWEPGEKHYVNAVERTRLAMKSGKLRGILWHQGESDAKEELARSYRERFAKFIARLREDLGAPGVPVVVGQLGEFKNENVHARTVNEQLATIPLVVPKSAFVSSGELQHKGDGTHFDSPSLREFGRRYALAFLSLAPEWAPAPAREQPPDRQAYSDAMRLADAEKKIAALEKFRRDFPESAMASSVDEQVFSTLVKKLPGETGRIRALAKTRYAAASQAQKGRTAAGIASTLLEGGVLLQDAEAWAKRSLKPLTETGYLAEQRAAAERRKEKPPRDEELRKRYRELRAERLAILGRIYVARGRQAQGRKTLEEAWSLNPVQPAAAAALGELALQAGRDREAIDYLTVARLSGRASRENIAAFEAVYRKLHNGSLDGVDAMLDAEYRKRFPNPVRAERSRPGAKRGDRVVLAEVFTGSGCPPCAGADLALDAVLERYPRDQVAVIMHHQHIPRPDPMSNPDTRARAAACEVRGVPTVKVDGAGQAGGGYREHAPEIFERLEGEIAKALAVPAGAKLSARAELAAGVVRVKASAAGIQGKAAALKLHTALVEKELRYSGENGIRFHPMVVRSLASHTLKGTGGAVEAAFDLAKIAAANRAHLEEYEKTGRDEPFQFLEKKHEINPANLAVAVYLEDPAAKKILQAQWVELER